MMSDPRSPTTPSRRSGRRFTLVRQTGFHASSHGSTSGSGSSFGSSLGPKDAASMGRIGSKRTALTVASSVKRGMDIRSIGPFGRPSWRSTDFGADDREVLESQELAEEWILKHFNQSHQRKRQEDAQRRKREEQRRLLALEILGIMQHDDAEDVQSQQGAQRRKSWCLRWLDAGIRGFRELRIRILVKRMEVQEEPPTYPGMYKLAKNLRFEMFIGLLIILNSLTICWDSFYQDGDERPWLLAISEHVFTVLFLGEFWIRIMAFTWVWVISSPMNTFDTFLVWVTGVFLAWVLPLLQVEDVQSLRNLGALRILRLTRLCRCIRMIPFFKELWTLVHGVLECSRLLFWTWIIVGSIHFMFGVAVVELVTKSETFKNDEDVEYYFGSLAQAMLTLFQIMTFDTWASVVRPIMSRSPEAAFVFILYMGIAGIVLFNLMTAIVVQNAFEQVKTDVEAVDHWNQVKDRKMRVGLQRIFEELDEDDSGHLSKEEFVDALDDVRFIRNLRLLDVDMEELPEMYDILDDGDGRMESQEFIGGLMYMQEKPRNRDVMHAQKLLKMNNAVAKEISESLGAMTLDRLESTEVYMQAMHGDAEDVLRMCAEVLGKLNDLGLHKTLTLTEPFLPPVPPEGTQKSQQRQPQQLTAETSGALTAGPPPLAIPPQSWMKRYLRRIRRAAQKEAVGNLAIPWEEKDEIDSDVSSGSPMEEGESSRHELLVWACEKLNIHLQSGKDLRSLADAFGDRKLRQPMTLVTLPWSMALPARLPVEFPDIPLPAERKEPQRRSSFSDSDWEPGAEQLQDHAMPNLPSAVEEVEQQQVGRTGSVAGSAAAAAAMRVATAEASPSRRSSRGLARARPRAGPPPPRPPEVGRTGSAAGSAAAAAAMRVATAEASPSRRSSRGLARARPRAGPPPPRPPEAPHPESLGPAPPPSSRPQSAPRGVQAATAARQRPGSAAGIGGGGGGTMHSLQRLGLSGGQGEGRRPPPGGWQGTLL